MLKEGHEIDCLYIVCYKAFHTKHYAEIRLFMKLIDESIGAERDDKIHTQFWSEGLREKIAWKT